MVTTIMPESPEVYNVYLFYYSYKQNFYIKAIISNLGGNHRFEIVPVLLDSRAIVNIIPESIVDHYGLEKYANNSLSVYSWSSIITKIP